MYTNLFFFFLSLRFFSSSFISYLFVLKRRPSWLWLPPIFLFLSFSVVGFSINRNHGEKYAAAAYLMERKWGRKKERERERIRDGALVFTFSRRGAGPLLIASLFLLISIALDPGGSSCRAVPFITTATTAITSTILLFDHFPLLILPAALITEKYV